MFDSWHSYPSIFALGHRAISELLLDAVLVEEKIDGSQFSFGIFEMEDGERVLKCRSKGAQLNIVAPDSMFKKGVEFVQSIQNQLTPGWTYRAEYLAKPKHNSLAYDRIPKNNIIIFDINIAEESYLTHAEKRAEAERLDLEVVPVMHYGKIENVQHFRSFLDTVSCLGAQKIEGIVVKNYNRFGIDKKVLMGKFVSEAFKEVHSQEWRSSNPTAGDILMMLGETYKTPARWNKAIQHLREAGQLEDSPRDIGLLIKEIPVDIEKECAQEIKDALFAWAWPHIRRKVTAGMPEWYKEKLLEKQFNVTEAPNA